MARVHFAGILVVILAFCGVLARGTGNFSETEGSFAAFCFSLAVGIGLIGERKWAWWGALFLSGFFALISAGLMITHFAAALALPTVLWGGVFILLLPITPSKWDRFVSMDNAPEEQAHGDSESGGESMPPSAQFPSTSPEPDDSANSPNYAGANTELPGTVRPASQLPNPPQAATVPPRTAPRGQKQQVGLSTSHKIVMWLGIVGLAFTGLRAPWIYTHDSTGEHFRKPAGYYWIFAPPKPDEEYGPLQGNGVRLDTGRLAIEWLLIVLVFGGLALTFRKKSTLEAHDAPVD